MEEMCAAWPSYFGYFGTFTGDADLGAVTHHIEGSWFPNLVGTEQVRHYRFEAGQLVLDADTAWGKVRIVWEKLPRTEQHRRNAGSRHWQQDQLTSAVILLHLLPYVMSGQG